MKEVAEMPRRNSNGGKRIPGGNARRNSIDVFDFIERYPTITTQRRRAAKQEALEKEATNSHTRKRHRKGGSQ